MRALNQKYGSQDYQDGLYDLLERWGNVRVDRFALAFVEDPANGRSCWYARVTGKLNNARFLKMLEQLRFKADAIDKPADGPPVAIVTHKLMPALALVGDSDWLLVSRTLAPDENTALKAAERRKDNPQKLQELLAVRAGKAPSLLQGPLAARVARTSPRAAGILVGGVPADWASVFAPGPAPKTMTAELISEDAGLVLRGSLLYGAALQARELAEQLRSGRDEIKERVAIAEKAKLPAALPASFYKDTTRLLDNFQATVDGKIVHLRCTAAEQLLNYVPLWWPLHLETKGELLPPRRAPDAAPKQ